MVLPHEQLSLQVQLVPHLQFALLHPDMMIPRSKSQKTQAKSISEFVTTQIGSRTNRQYNFNFDYPCVPFYANMRTAFHNKKKGGKPQHDTRQPIQASSVLHQRRPCCGHVGDLIQASTLCNHSHGRRFSYELPSTGCTNCEATC